MTRVINLRFCVSTKAAIVSILFLYACSQELVAQARTDGAKYQFAREVFRSKYKRQRFDSYNGEIVQINETTFRYGGKVLTVYLDDKSLVDIFLRGILHADIIGGKETTKRLTKSQLDSMSTKENVFYNLTRNDSIMIGNVEELEKLNPDHKTKRFKFWLYRREIPNPTECYFECITKKQQGRLGTRNLLRMPS